MRGKAKQRVSLILVVTMVLGTVLTGNTVFATGESSDEQVRIKINISKDSEQTVEQNVTQTIHVTAQGQCSQSVCLNVYLKNEDGSAATDIDAVNLLTSDQLTDKNTQKTIDETLKDSVTLNNGTKASPTAEWKNDKDDNGTVTSKYLQITMPADATAINFDMQLQYRTDESNYTKKVLVEAKAFEGEQDVTEASDAEGESKENEAAVVWANEQTAGSRQRTEAAVQDAVSTTASLDENYVYLDPTGMNLGGTDWKNQTVWLYVNNDTWKNKFMKGEYDTSTGYYRWPSKSWSNAECNFFFTLSDNWDTIKANEYYRTDVVPEVKLSQAAGKAFTQNGTASQKIDNRNVYAVKEKSNSVVTPEPSGDYLVYFDAALSKLSYAGTTTDNSIPKDGKIGYHAWNDTSDKITGVLDKVGNYTDTDGTHTWSDVYVAKLKKKYTHILFFGGDSIPNTKCALKTKDLVIPWDKENRCFYADSSDDVIYDNSGEDTANRDGYWDSVYQIRDAEAGKTGKDVVDIKKGTFTRDSNTLYVNSTFYDYYTDYEMNGNNRDYYGGDNSVSYRNWVTFRQFNQALSDYYSKNSTTIPIYTGHFQPDYSDWNYRFSAIAGTLNLYGYDKNNQKKFMSTNNSTLDINGGDKKYDFAAQGLVAGQLNNNQLMTSDGKAEEPHFNEAFLTGENNKNAVLGEVYHNVSFPFKKEDIKNNGVNYWTFDSAETTLAMKQDSSTKAYYLQDTGNQNWSKNVDSSSQYGKDSEGKDRVSNTYGFFPFNETSTAASAKNYNYGFGTRMDLTFKLTDDGTVTDKNGNKVPVEFEFSGDDDVWVYIDGKLALDVGGAHGRVTGNLNFQSKKATVSKVKASAGSSVSGKDVTSDFTLSGKNSDEHILTLFYMERGMWESNMKITFNFPDENEFAVEKKVDTTAVNKDLFPDSLFENASVFPFTIMNQATHYGTKTADSQNAKSPKVYNDKFDSSTLSKNVTQNTFEYAAEKEGQSEVVHWKAKQNDTTGSYIDKRVGIIAPAGGSTFDASDTNAFLQFKMYYDYPDTPALANMYLALTDSAGHKIGGYLSGKTYGISNLTGKNWNTIKVDLSKLQGTDTFDYFKITGIQFNYNYERDIYLDDFTFIPSVVLTARTGFVTKQNEIPDYGSAKSGTLEYPKDAQYTISKNGSSKSYRMEGDGAFALADGETATFHDQFRRGSYISVKENVDSDVFDTSWTLYENGEAVAGMNTGSTVQNTSPVPSVKGVKGTGIRDGRKEVYQSGTDSEGQELANSGYPKTDWAKDKNKEDDQDTIVFRSYLDPNNTTSSTKLKAVFVNKVKTGKIVIKKVKADGSDDLSGTYSFDVEFKNVAGLSLEPSAIKRTYTCEEGKEFEIDGIPAGTDYRISEITPTDGSTLESVTITSNNESDASYDPVTKVVAGKVTASTKTVITFANTKKPTLNINLAKAWNNVEGITLPNSIKIQLQRSTDGVNWKAIEYAGQGNIITLQPDYDGNWKYTFDNLDQYVDYRATPQVSYQYQVVEVDKDGNVIEDGGYLNDIYRVNYSDVIDGASAGTGSGDAAEKTKDYTITNTYSPKTNIKIKKQDASTKNPLNGAEFKLEKLKDDGNGTWIVDETFQALTKTTTGKDNSNKELGEALFEDLEDGTYRLTETKAAENHSLLKDPVIIVINRSDECLIDNEECEVVDNTISITISNQARFDLPATGGYGRYIVILGGIALAGVGLFMYRLQKRRKEGNIS